MLCNYDGTLILVSHDRTFLDNVVTSTLAFEGDGIVNEYIGGYEDWLRQSKQKAVQKEIKQPQASEVKTESPKQEKKKVKLSYKDQRELDGLPQKIEELEHAYNCRE